MSSFDVYIRLKNVTFKASEVLSFIIRSTKEFGNVNVIIYLRPVIWTLDLVSLLYKKT